jgi:AhpD family alkylhydroperoxidase
MELRARAREDMQRDAIKTGIAKAAAGCVDCATGYVALARREGASDGDLKAAIAASPVAAGVSRRKLLKLALASGAVIATSGVLGKEAAATPFYWGTDSNGATTSPIPQNFYIGRFGYGLTSSTQYFNTSAARSTGPSPVHPVSRSRRSCEGPPRLRRRAG